MTNIKDRSQMIYQMDTEICYMQMEISIEEIGWMVWRKEKGFKYTTNWSMNTKDSGETISMRESGK